MEVLNKAELTTVIEEAIHQLRPFLEADGGDIKLVDIVDNVAQVKLLGACETCNVSKMTLKAGVEEAVKKVAPQITGVVAI